MLDDTNAILFMGAETDISAKAMKKDPLAKALAENGICDPYTMTPVNFLNRNQLREKVIVGISPKTYMAAEALACISFPISPEDRGRANSSKIISPPDPFRGKSPIAYQAERNFEVEHKLANDPSSFFKDSVLETTVLLGYNREDLAKYTLAWMGVEDAAQIGGGICDRTEDLTDKVLVMATSRMLPFYKQILASAIVHLFIDLPQASPGKRDRSEPKNNQRFPSRNLRLRSFRAGTGKSHTGRSSLEAYG